MKPSTLASLVEVNAALLQKRNAREIGEVVVRAAVDALDAESGTLFITEGTALKRVHGDDVEAHAIGEIKQPTYVGAVATLPLLIEGRALGVITFRFHSAVGNDARSLLELLAMSAAQALERVRLRRQFDDASGARAEILSVVSHDLRNPLSAILMAAGSMLRVEGEDPAVVRFRMLGDRIQRNVERMTRLIQDLVDFSAVTSGTLMLKRADHSPEGIVRAVVDVLSAIAEPRELRLVSRIDGPLPPLTCDEHRVVQAISNLVANAVKVTAPGGVVTVSASLVERDIVFAVHDTGPGITPAELAHVFDRSFSSTSTGYQDIGLGLGIAKGIAEAHGGRIFADSVLGEGSTFSISIPGVVVD